MKAALITTCFREADAIHHFLDAILSQTRQPDEIIIVDAGSDDGTIEAIQSRIENGAPVILIIQPGASRADGRNRAIGEATSEIIAVTDVGCLPQPDWFELIVEPFEDESVDVVSGFYLPDPLSTWDEAVASATVPALAEIDPEAFMPSSRSVAFRKSAWEQVSGYPQCWWGSNDTAEDTAFDIALRDAGARFIFQPRAVVTWHPNSTARGLFRQFEGYARGDAARGLWFGHYTKICVLIGVKWVILAGGFFWTPIWLGLLGLLIAYWSRHALRASRRTASWRAALLAPAANWLVDVAHVFGYLRGISDRRDHEPRDH